jgi:hypothetical protein
VRGVYRKLLWESPPRLSHEHGDDPDRIRRYRIGESRLAFLKEHAKPFAYRAKADGEQIAAFLAEVDQSDLDPEMPPDTRYEYLAGSVLADGTVVLYAYLWFRSLAEAKQYVLRHGMRIEGGWSDEEN